MRQKFYYLERNKTFSEVNLLKTTPHKRLIEYIDGAQKGKQKAIHPEGAAWGSLYPRLHEAIKKPEGFFIYKGRVLLKNETPHALTPPHDPHYNFQSFTTHVIDSINHKENVLLTGPTGVGKTSPIVQLAAKTNQPLIRVNFNGETRLSDFIGKLQIVGGETKWVDGVLPQAMRLGYWLLLDEIDFADPAVLSLLHPVLEENPHLVLKENAGEVIYAHPNFRLFATANSIGAMQDKASSYSGTNTMNEAFLDRFQVILVKNLSAKEELKIVKKKVSGLKSRWAKRIVEFAQKVREQSIEGMEISGDGFSTRRVLHWAKKTALLRSPIEGAKLSWLDKMPGTDHEALMRILELHFGNAKRQRKEKVTVAHGLNPGPKKRGRPRKNPPTHPIKDLVDQAAAPTPPPPQNEDPGVIAALLDLANASNLPPPKKKRGRPRKNPTP